MPYHTKWNKIGVELMRNKQIRIFDVIESR